MLRWDLWVCRPVGSVHHHRQRISGKAITLYALLLCALMSSAVIAGWQLSAHQSRQALKAIQP